MVTYKAEQWMKGALDTNTITVTTEPKFIKAVARQ
jgi:hypothetical protein